jgi:uncharacterized spore protein YtfJ
MPLDDLVKGMLEQIGKVARSSAVTGQVRDAGAAKVVPLSKVSIGFGTGIAGLDGQRKSEESSSDAGVQGGAAGGALMVEPRAFVVIDENGMPHMLALKGKRAEIRQGIVLPGTEPTLESKEAPQLPPGKRNK